MQDKLKGGHEWVIEFESAPESLEQFTEIFVFMLEPIVEKSRAYAVYFGLVEGHIVVTLGFVIGVEFLEFKV